VAGLSGWTLGYAVCNQVSLFAVLALANGERPGAVSAYTYAFIFFQLPHGLLAVSIMTTFLPDLSAFAARLDFAGFRERFGLGSRLLILVILPAAIGYVVLARPVIAALLERGAFGNASGDLTAEVLAAMALGLVGFSVYLFVLRGFYALKDTRTPFLVNLFENAVNIALAFALVGRFGVQGLALAYAGAYSVAAVLAVVLLRRRIGGMDGRRTLPALAKMAVAAAVMAVAVVLARELVGSNTGLGAVARTAAGVIVGIAVYLAALYALRLPELHELVDRLRARRGGKPAGAAL
jgi:putative peptidoglycan lipid II flippase